MKPSSLFLALSLVLGGSALLRAEQLFVLFDGSCGDRIRYEQAVARQPLMDYYAYAFNLPGGRKLMLETGAEGSVTQSYLPQGYIYCNDPRLGIDLVDRVNGGADRVFIIRPVQGGQYLIAPVVMGAVFERNGQQLSYRSPLSSFQFDTNNGIIGVNLAVDNPEAKVYFEGRDNNACSGTYIFRQLQPRAAYPVIDYKVVPEIGVTERRLGSDGSTTAGGGIIAREVNGQPVAEYIRSVCASASALARNGGTLPNRPATTAAPTVPGPTPANSYPGAPQTYAGGGLVSAPQPYTGTPQPYSGATSPDVQPESQAYASNPGPTVTTSQTHRVVKGETLFAISRRYNTTVDAIKANNGLTSNTVYPGQELAVMTTTVASNPSPPATAPTSPTAVAMNPAGSQFPPAPANVPNARPTLPYNAGPVAGSNPGAATPVPYGTTGSTATPQPYGQTATPPAYATDQAGYASRGVGEAVYGEDTHTVEPGETVASIALKYGYTSAKFREMNELGPNEFIKVGQRLKTSDCNCPAQQVTPQTASTAVQTPPNPQSQMQAPTAAPTSYGNPAYPYPGTQANPLPNAAPTSYGGTPAPAVAPSSPLSREVGGTRLEPGAPIQQPRSPQPAGNEPMISNNPNFGQVVPNAAAAPSTTLSELESQAPVPMNTGGTARTVGERYFPETGRPQPYPAARANQQYGGAPTTPAPAPQSYGTPSAPQPQPFDR